MSIATTWFRGARSHEKRRAASARLFSAWNLGSKTNRFSPSLLGPKLLCRAGARIGGRARATGGRGCARARRGWLALLAADREREQSTKNQQSANLLHRFDLS